MEKYQNKLHKFSIWASLIFFAIRCALGLYGGDKAGLSVKIIYQLFGYATEAIGLSAVVCRVIEKLAWRWYPVNKMLGGVPILHGTYNITLKSNYKTSKFPDGVTKRGTVEFVQTLTDLSVKLKTDESQSISVNACLCDENGDRTLIYTYRNEPQSTVRDHSEIHYGTARFHLNKTLDKIQGDYYTDRNTTGTMNLKRKKK